MTHLGLLIGGTVLLALFGVSALLRVFKAKADPALRNKLAGIEVILATALLALWMVGWSISLHKLSTAHVTFWIWCALILPPFMTFLTLLLAFVTKPSLPTKQQ